MKTHFYRDDILAACDHKHLTVDQIFEKIQKKFPRAGRSSIYRNVRELVESGELKEVSGDGKKAFFEKNIGPHAHAVCQKTGKIFDVDVKNLKLAPLPHKFKTQEISIKIVGVLE